MNVLSKDTIPYTCRYYSLTNTDSFKRHLKTHYFASPTV